MNVKRVKELLNELANECETIGQCNECPIANACDEMSMYKLIVLSEFCDEFVDLIQ